MRTQSHGPLLLLLLLCMLAAPAAAQNAPEPTADTPPSARLMFGPFGAVALNMHRGQFTTFDGLLECGTFNDATNPGWQAGNVLDIPLSGPFAMSARLYYHKANGDFTSPNPVTPNISLNDGSLVRLVTEEKLATALDYVMVDLLGKWNFTRALYIAAGPSIGLATRDGYEQEESIVSPNGVTFTNGQGSRKIVAGSFDEQGTQNARRNVRLAATGGLGADIPISSRFVLNPEIGYTLPFTNVLSSFTWKVSDARAGVALKYMFGTEEAAAPPPPLAALPQPVLDLDAENQLEDGSRLNYAEITVAEDRLIDVMPLLPYVFFDQNSSTIPARYSSLGGSGTTGFNESTLRDSVLGIYHDVLNIIGERMRRYPQATITVTGCREPIEDTDGDAVAAGRAARVKEYLVSAWGIDPARIAVAKRTLPGAVSNRTIAEGREENRRAEISSTDPRILAPVRRLSRANAIDPAAIAILPRVQFGDSIRDWNLKIADMKGTELYATAGNGVPAADVVWKVERIGTDTTARRRGEHLTATLTAGLGDDRKVVVSRDIPVRRTVRSQRFNGEIVRDSLLERYGLMFFDFDTPNISDFNQQVVQLIQGRIQTNSAVRITGLTDRIGESDYNLALSTRRAESTARRIQSRIVPDVITTAGAGETLIYNNDLPEGRFYNRTVVVEIATPLDESEM